MPLASEELADGRAAFEKAQCMACHSGAAFTDNQVHDVGTGGVYKTPSLVGVGERTLLMHNGCAETLEERFTACGGANHGNTDELSEGELKDLVSYLRSL